MDLANGGDPIARGPDGKRRCSAHNRQGEPCRKPPIRGGTVCATHGGSAGHIKRAARMRLLELIDPAVAQLARLMVDGDTDTVKLRAVENVLDRAGVPRATTSGVVVEDAKGMLVERLTALMDGPTDGLDEALADVHEMVEQDETKEQGSEERS